MSYENEENEEDCSSCLCLSCIRTKEVGVIENLGDFDKIVGPGLQLTLWPIQYLAKRISLRVQQLEVRCETKTKDNVFIEVEVAVQYRISDNIIPDDGNDYNNGKDIKDNNNKTTTGGIYAACYRLTNPIDQIQSYVFDVLGNTIPKLELDDVYVNKKTIANAVKKELSNVMRYYGYQIVNTLVIDLKPTDHKIMASMNEINASKRLKEAKAYAAEANKMKLIKLAEAEAEAKYLRGYGTARQRKAIVQSLQVNVTEFMDEVNEESKKKDEPMIDPKDVMDVLLLTEYADTMREAGSNTLYLPHDPGFVASIRKPTTVVKKSLSKGNNQSGSRIFGSLRDFVV